MDDLKPCPFCGRRPTVFEYSKNDIGETYDSHVVVQCCAVVTQYVEPVSAARRHAIATWNTRASEARDE